MLLAVVMLGLAVAGWAPAARSPQFDPRTQADLSSLVRGVMATDRIPGVVVGVWVPGRGTWVRSFGKANVATGAPMRATDYVRIASITKTFAATAVLQLVEQGRLRLDEHLSRFVKGLPNGNRITIRNLLGMTSGLYSFTEDPTFDRDFERNPTFNFGLRQMIAIVRRHGPNFAPGASVEYSDTNYLLLGAIIAKVTGQGADRIIQKQILDPLGLKQTSLPRTPAMPRPFAHGYYGGVDGKGPLRDYTRVNPKVPWTGGGMVSTLADLRTWAKALATGALLSKSMQAQRLRFRAFAKSPFSYGLGIGREYGFIGHDGSIFGFNTVAYYLPTRKATVVVEANKSTNDSLEAEKIFYRVAKRLFPGQFPAGAARPASARGPAAVRASLRSDLDTYLSARRAAEHISALSVAVTFRGKRPGINVAVGTDRFGGGGPVSTNALWQICSNTKAFTAVILLQLEAEHKLSINDTLGKWLPRYRAWGKVTIKRLLNMTSGIPDYLTPAFNRDFAVTPPPVFSAARLVSYAVGPPTTGYNYSNTNYVLAQMIIERATHDSYGDQLRRRIIGPLRLRNTFYSATVYPRSVNDRLPAGYFFDHSIPSWAALMGTDQSHRTLSAAQGAGAIVSSLQDMAKWDRALYTGRMIPRRQQRELQSVVSLRTGKPIKRTTEADPAGFGLGVMQSTNVAWGGTVWYYEGSGYAFRVLHIYVPRSGTVVALGMNSATDADDGTRLLASLYGVLHRAGLA